MIISVIALVFGALVSAIITARISKLWNERRTQKIVAEQQAEFLRQQQKMQEIESQQESYGEQLADSQSAEKTVNVLEQIKGDWNEGK